MPPSDTYTSASRSGASTPSQRRHLAHLGLNLFLASLAMLFGASIAAYVLIRVRLFGEFSQIPPLGAIHIPIALALSTVILLATSYTMHRALAAVRRERQVQLRRSLVASAVLAAAFIAVQVPSLIVLLQDHYAALQGSQRIFLYGMIFFLIVLHAAHVLGGLIGLGLTIKNAFKGRYDHEHHQGVRQATIYWHFIDIVWLIMFILFFALR